MAIRIRYIIKTLLNDVNTDFERIYRKKFTQWRCAGIFMRQKVKRGREDHELRISTLPWMYFFFVITVTWRSTTCTFPLGLLSVTETQPVHLSQTHYESWMRVLVKWWKCWKITDSGITLSYGWWEIMVPGRLNVNLQVPSKILIPLESALCNLCPIDDKSFTEMSLRTLWRKLLT